MDRLSQPNTYHLSMSTELETKLQELRDELELLTSMVRAERLTATAANQQCTDEQGERAHKVLDQCIAFASVPQQDVGAGRSVPSPVGQEPTMEQVREVVKAWILDNFDIEIEEHTLGSHNLQERLSALFTHPPKAGVLSALKAGDPTS